MLQVICPICKTVDIIKIHEPKLFEFDYMCPKCEKGFNRIEINQITNRDKK